MEEVRAYLLQVWGDAAARFRLVAENTPVVAENTPAGPVAP